MRIDHLVWYAHDLAEGRKHFGETMNCQAAYGGEHPGEGTANAVMGLGTQTYLEILGRDPAQNGEGLDPEVGSLQGSGLYHWAVAGLDLGRLGNRASDAGLETGALVPGGRTKPDGTMLGWTCLGIRNHGFGALVPFFIDWMDSEHPALAAPPGGRLVEFKLHTPRADALREIFRNLALDIEICDSPADRISAVLQSDKGRVELGSFDPVPRGYVI